MDIEELFSKGLHYQRGKQLEQARFCFEEVLKGYPTHPGALYNLALVCVRTGNLLEAISKLTLSLKNEPGNKDALMLLGDIHRHRGSLVEAKSSYKKAYMLPVSDLPCICKLGSTLFALGEFEATINLFQKHFDELRDNAFGRKKLAACFLMIGDYESAYLHGREASILDPTDSENWNILGVTLRRRLQPEEALVCYERAIAINNKYAEVFNNKGLVLHDLKRFGESVHSYEKAIELKPDYSNAWCNHGNSLVSLGRYEEALRSINRSLELRTDSAETWMIRGNILRDLNRFEESLISYDRSITLKADYAEAWNNRGVVLRDLKRFEESLTSCDRSIHLNSQLVEGWINRGTALYEIKRYQDALISYERAIQLSPNFEWLEGDLVLIMLKLCSWNNIEERIRSLGENLIAGRPAGHPFVALGLFDDLQVQKRCAGVYAASKWSSVDMKPITRNEYKKEKICIGYFSMDFREHAVSYLIAGLIEQHDRGQFEVFGFSYGVNTADPVRKRLEKSFDKFFDVKNMSDLEIVDLSRAQGVDIAVDLAGYTKDSRPGIFARRAAPLQINYLGYPGTLGSKDADYLIADPIIIPRQSREGYSEKIIYLPGSYQINDSKRKVSDRIFSREELGLPERGVILCCFNSSWKILPEVFDGWMRILRSSACTYLWLYEDNCVAASNLREEAVKRGVDPNRLVFAGRAPQVEHLARYKLADLFLDTYPYGAHTTASDAIWSGVPVITRCGTSFASRVASSLLYSVGLPELITYSAQDYECLVLELLTDSNRLHELKQRLFKNKAVASLFNSTLVTRQIESAYSTVFDRYRSGGLPDHLEVGLPPLSVTNAFSPPSVRTAF